MLVHNSYLIKMSDEVFVEDLPVEYIFYLEVFLFDELDAMFYA